MHLFVSLSCIFRCVSFDFDIAYTRYISHSSNHVTNIKKNKKENTRMRKKHPLKDKFKLIAIIRIFFYKHSLIPLSEHGRKKKNTKKKYWLSRQNEFNRLRVKESLSEVIEDTSRNNYIITSSFHFISRAWWWLVGPIRSDPAPLRLVIRFLRST